MKSAFLLIIHFCTFLTIAFAQSPTEETLCTPGASAEAKALYRFLLDMKGKYILSGQQDSPWGIDEMAHILYYTGKQPALKGMDFISQSDNPGEVQKTIDWWNSGGIPTIMWHWGAPSKGEGYNETLMEIDIDRCFIEGTLEYKAFRTELSAKADLLTILRDAHVPVLWRPFHELNGHWFWWGKQGSDRFKKLWIEMYEYFVYERGLNNLIWVLCYIADPDPAWYPGDNYVDIAGADTYNTGNDAHLPMYNEVKAIINDRFPIAYHECGIPPDPDDCLAKGAIWSWWMEWHTDWLTGVDSAYLNRVYNHEIILTLDELPDIMEEYGTSDDTCNASELIPKLKIDDGDWTETNTIQLGSGDSVLLSPVASDNGTWIWRGLGTSGNSAVQTVSLGKAGIVTAFYINSCGATSSLSYRISDLCPPTSISPFSIITGGIWQRGTEISLEKGQTVTLSPQPVSGGSWNWSGAATGNTRIISLKPDSSCSVTAVFTNSCGRSTELVFYITVSIPSPVIYNLPVNEMHIYPNPCMDILNLSIQGINLNGYSLSIYNSGGQLEMNRIITQGNSALDVSFLNPGIYCLFLNSDRHFIHKTFIKSKY